MANPLNLKVGDKVRLNLDGLSYYSDFGDQDVLTVTKVDESDQNLPYQLRADKDTVRWVRSADIICKVEDKPKAKHKVGDKVRVKSREWYEKNKDGDGYVRTTPAFNSRMSDFCGKTLTIKKVGPSDDIYQVEEFDYWWSDEMFEDEPTASALETVVKDIASIANATTSRIKSILHKDTPTVNVTLIRTNVLLTNIKTDL